MKSNPRVHYQLRLVKRINRERAVTYSELAQPKELRASDKTLDFGTERGALQKARNYCARGAHRKGPLPGEFLGVVVVSHESDHTKWGAVKQTNIPGGFELSKRPRRVTGTTTWLYYLDCEGIAFDVDPKTHKIGKRVTT